ncbi:unnamed protein product [Paramecium primaurelia]|uniref:Uncharacterized protein n=1 Tax=Paramecium primaurelia TaxID=5886 RepID=A0A8S1NK42_PARPR|nr:unnamed protein product [Paramecium primaurelia]
MYYLIIIFIGIAWYCWRDNIKCIFPITSKDTILITGACMGLGKALAIECAKKKCKLILLDVRSDLSLDLLQDIRKEGSEAQFYRCDLSDLQSTKELISMIKQKYKVTILINNAGVGIFKLFEDETIEDVIKTNTINYLAPAMLTQEFIKDNINHIVNIGSAASIVQGMKITAYSASKHAMWGFHNALRMELKYQNSNVRTTLVCPWGIKTGMIQGLKTKLDYFLPMMTPEYVAQCILQAIEAGREIIFIQWYQFYIAHISRLLSSKIVDWFILFVQAKHVHEFKGRYA